MNTQWLKETSDGELRIRRLQTAISAGLAKTPVPVLDWGRYPKYQLPPGEEFLGAGGDIEWGVFYHRCTRVSCSPK